MVASLTPPDDVVVWNLFWLSVPALDSLPIFGKRPDWAKHYTPVEGALKAIVADAVDDDEVLRRKLQLHPQRFIEWFEREDHSIYDSYYALNGETWVSTVLARSKEAAARIDAAVVASRKGNIYTFKSRVA